MDYGPVKCTNQLRIKNHGQNKMSRNFNKHEIKKK
jgi:hypothetical protein